METIGKEAEIVFLATPAGVSAELTPKLLAEGLKVIDLSGDFRMMILRHMNCGIKGQHERRNS